MEINSTKSSSTAKLRNDRIRRAYAAMRQWGDTERDDEILEGSCEVRYLSETEIEVAATVLATLEKLHDQFGKSVAEFLPALLAESMGGAENLAIEHGITIPRCATTRRKARDEAIRGFVKT
jgi:hypothetical protein